MHPIGRARTSDQNWRSPLQFSKGVTLAFAGFLPVLVIMSLAPAVPTLIAHFSAVPHATTLIPLMVTTPGLVVALLAPFAGVTVDRVGRRLPLLAAITCYAVAGLAPLAFNGIVAIIVSRLCVGACEAFVLVGVNALLADYFEPDQRRYWLTVQGVAFPFLTGGVAMLAGRLTDWAWNGAFFAYALVIPICLAVYLFCTEPAIPSASEVNAPINPGSAFPRRETAIICAVTVFASAMFYVYVVQVSVAYDAVGMKSGSLIGRNIGLAALSAPIGAVLFSKLSRRFHAEGAVTVCLAIMAVGMVVIGFASTSNAVLLGSVIQQVSAGMLIPSLIYWVASVYQAEHRGRAFGLWSSASFVSQFLSPLMVGAVREAVGGILMTFAALGIVTLVVAAVMTILVRRPLRLAALS